MLGVFCGNVAVFIFSKLLFLLRSIFNKSKTSFSWPNLPSSNNFWVSGLDLIVLTMSVINNWSLPIAPPAFLILPSGFLDIASFPDGLIVEDFNKNLVASPNSFINLGKNSFIKYSILSILPSPLTSRGLTPAFSIIALIFSLTPFCFFTLESLDLLNIPTGVPLLISCKADSGIPSFCNCSLTVWLVIALPVWLAKAIILADIFLSALVGLPSTNPNTSKNSTLPILGFLFCTFKPAPVLDLTLRLL